jgi:ABC-type uncharacterized transport system fused permease/ATPase subunit
MFLLGCSGETAIETMIANKAIASAQVWIALTLFVVSFIIAAATRNG